MLRAAVLGSPVEHSLSPVLHTAAYAVCGLTHWSYGRWEVTASELGAAVGSLDESWRGLSLTMPLKEAAFAITDEVSEIARRAGAINTLVRRPDGGWDATNTDVQGFIGALTPLRLPDRQPDDEDPMRAALVLGSGATARSAVLALAELGVRELQIAARNAESAAALGGLGHDLGLDVDLVPFDRWADDLPVVVVSTLPPEGALAAAAAMSGDGDGDTAGAVLLDVVYAGWPTPLARAFTVAGGEVLSGLELLVHQAAAQFELFTGHPAPVDAMFAAGRRALGSA